MYGGVGRQALHADLHEAAVVVEHALVVVVPEDVRGLLQRLRDHALEAHRAARLHVQVRLAHDLDLGHCNVYSYYGYVLCYTILCYRRT